MKTEPLWVKFRDVASLQPVGFDAVLVAGGSWLLVVDAVPPHKQSIYQAEEGVQVAGGHRNLPCMAYAEKSKDPRIFILLHPGFKLVRTLPEAKDGKYHALEFSEMELLFGLLIGSNGTDIVVWNWRTVEQMSVIRSAIQDPGKSIRASPTSPIRLAEWGVQGITVWQTHPCYRKSFYSSITVPWPPSVKTPVAVSWSVEGDLFILDSMGSLFLKNLETGLIQMEFRFPNPSTNRSENLPSPCLAASLFGLSLHAEGQVAMMKKRGEGWALAWICQSPPLVDLVNMGGIGKEKYLGWTEKNQLVAFLGEKHTELNVLYEYGSSFDMACIIRPEADKILSFSMDTKQLSLWELKTGILVDRDSFGTAHNLLTMEAAPSAPYVVLGFSNGVFEILTFSPNVRRLFHPTRKPIDTIRFLPSSDLFCVASATVGEFFVVELGSGSSLRVAGSLQANCRVVDFFLEDGTGACLVILATSNPHILLGGNTIYRYRCDEESQNIVLDREVLLEREYLQIQNATDLGGFLAIPFPSRRLHLMNYDFKVLRQWQSGHLLSKLQAKIIENNIVTYGVDGLVIFHIPGSKSSYPVNKTSPSASSTILTHQRADGGVVFIDCDMVNSIILAGGHDTCLVRYAAGSTHEKNEKYKELKCQKSEISLALLESDKSNETWLEKWEKNHIVQVQAQFKEVKLALLDKLDTLKKKVSKLIDDNETSPEDEKLSLYEFELDVAGRKRVIEEERLSRELAHQMEVSRIKVQDSLAARIVEFTWSPIKIHSRELRPILPSPNAISVHSYALPLVALSTQNCCVEWMEERRKIVHEFHTGDFFQPWIPRSDRSIKSHVSQASSRLNFDTRERLVSEFLNPTGTESLPCVSTSTHLFLPERKLPHSQLQVNTKYHAKDIMLMTRTVILELMKWFNNAFAAVASCKERELLSLAEKRSRLRQVASDLQELGAPCHLQPEDLADPSWAPTEVPETLLKVEDNELTTSPYFSPEELEKQRLDADEAETRRLMLLADDFRERALVVMMDGVLEKKWQDEIKKDIVKPAFMDEKLPMYWNEEEGRKAKIYHESVEKLHIERERYKKLLSAEFKQLATSTQESCERFDKKVNTLHELKLRVESAVCQEQLNLLRMRQEILQKTLMDQKEEEIKSVILEMEKKLERLQDESAKLQELLNEGRAALEILQSRDKNLDKNFKKDFPEYSPIISEQLHKLSKKRPKLIGRSANNPALLSELGRCALQGDDRSPRLPLPTDCLDYLKGVDALDGPINTPAVVSEVSWETMCRLRRSKIDSELKIRALTIDLSETEQTALFWQKQIKISKETIYKKQTELETLHSEKRMAELDCAVQLVVPQQIVEVPTTGRISDFSGACLLSRTVVDEINQAIQRVGTQKVRAMQRACDFRKGIVYKEWEHQKLRLRVDDLKAQLDALEHVHLTKELQGILIARANGVYDEKGFTYLENELRAVNLRFEKSELALLHSIEEHDKKIAFLDRQNNELDKKIVSLNKSLGRRAMLRDVKMEEHEVKESKIRMRNILRRGRLISRAQELENELVALQSERDVLSLKAYPTIIQKD